MGDTASAKPAFVGVFKDRRFAFLRVAYERITHADFNALAASVTGIFIKIDMFKCHLFASPIDLSLPQLRQCLRAKHAFPAPL
jgi:hypothetical protein